MNDLAGICIFIAIMTALSIPIIAVLKHRPRNPEYDKRIGELEKRVLELEGESARKTIELEGMRKEISFTSKLIGK